MMTARTESSQTEVSRRYLIIWSNPLTMVKPLAVLGEDETNPVKQWKNQVDLSHIESAERKAVTDMLEHNQAIWDG
jgi:hypothetical protein